GGGGVGGWSGGVRDCRGRDGVSPVKLPTSISVPATPSGSSPDRVSYFTVPSQNGDDRYRVRASIDPQSSNLLIIATSLASVDGTLHRLLLIELFVSLAVLAAIAVLGLWIVRLGLPPLTA